MVVVRTLVVTMRRVVLRMASIARMPAAVVARRAVPGMALVGGLPMAAVTPVMMMIARFGGGRQDDESGDSGGEKEGFHAVFC